MIVKKSVHVIFDEFNDLPLRDVSRNVGIEENMESLEITQDDKETQEETNEKNIQIEVVLPQLEDQKHDVKIQVFQRSGDSFISIHQISSSAIHQEG